MVGTHEQGKKKQSPATISLKQKMRKKQVVAERQKKAKELEKQWRGRVTIQSESEKKTRNNYKKTEEEKNNKFPEQARWKNNKKN